MSMHLHNDLTYLEQSILAQSARVEEMINKACQGLRELRRDVAHEVMAREDEVDQQEIRIEEECLKILALHQPVAVDLRRVTTVLKINAELERVGDLAVNIAERTVSLCNHPEFPIPATLERMSQLATAMVHDAMDAFVCQSVSAARDVCRRDDEVDDCNRDLIIQLQRLMRNGGSVVVPALHFFSAARQVERIGDHATNIAEDVVYLVEGQITRHRRIHDVDVRGTI